VSKSKKKLAQTRFGGRRDRPRNRSPFSLRVPPFSRKPVVAEEQVLLPVLDGSGAPVKDKDGEPLTYWATRARVLTDAQPKLANSKIEVQGPSGIKVSYEDK
jgi:hypothetical protein